MKLLSTIAFLLLTFSAFSQEKLSYQDGIIKQGEEVLSLEELSVLVNGADITYTNDFSTRQFKFNAEKTKRLRLAANNKDVANALNAVPAARIATGILLVPMGLVTSVFSLGGLPGMDDTAPPGGVYAGLAVSVLGIGLAGSSAAKIGTSESFGQRAEESIHKAVKLYNASLLEAQ